MVMRCLCVVTQFPDRLIDPVDSVTKSHKEQPMRTFPHRVVGLVILLPHGRAIAVSLLI